MEGRTDGWSWKGGGKKLRNQMPGANCLFILLRWAPGEPSFFAKNRKVACVAIHADPDWGKWSDESCVMETPFACKTRRKWKYQALNKKNLAR